MTRTRAITADASKVTAREFLDAVGLSSPEIRAERQARLERECIDAIKSGDTYGWPPVLVEHCRKLMDGPIEPARHCFTDRIVKPRRAA